MITTITDNEKRLLNILESHGYQIDRESIKRGKVQCDFSTATMGNWAISVFKPSEKEYELTFSGKHKGYDFSACLLLSFIHEMFDWTKFADMTDYPEMCKAGDWSAIRDTHEDKLWAIWNEVVIPLYIEGRHAVVDGKLIN